MFRLKELRQLQNISQQKLADRFGVSRSTVSMWEIESSQPDNQTLCALADYFNVSVDYLLGISDEQKNPESKMTPDNNDKNIVRIAARNGEFFERKMSDEQIDALRKIIEQMPEFTD